MLLSHREAPTMPVTTTPCPPQSPLWMPLFRCSGLNLATIVRPEAATEWGRQPARIVCGNDDDEGDDDATEDEDLDDIDPLGDEDSNFDDFDDEFDDDFEEDESDPDWDHPDDLRPEAPPPGKSAGGKK